MAELTLAQFAELSLRMERGELRPDVLREAGLSETEWLEQQMAWLERMSVQLERQRSELFERYLKVRKQAAENLGETRPGMGPSGAASLAKGSAGGEGATTDPSAPKPNTAFVPVEPPALYAPPVGGVPRATPPAAQRSIAPPQHLSSDYGAAPAAYAPLGIAASASELAPIQAPAPAFAPQVPPPPVQVSVAPPAFVSQAPAPPPPVYVAPVANIAPPAFVSQAPAPPPVAAVVAPPPVVSRAPMPVAPMPVAPMPVAAPMMSVAPMPVAAPMMPVAAPMMPMAAPMMPVAAPMMSVAPLAPVQASPPVASPTQAFFVPASTIAQAAAPVVQVPATHPGTPQLSMTQLALLVAELTVFPDRIATTLAEFSLNAQTWPSEWAAWTTQFTAQPEEYARYQPLVEYYTALRKPRESKP